jgi:hypothetical protein
MKLNYLILNVLTVFTIDSYINPAHSQTPKEVIQVSQKKYIKPEHIKGLDTYNKPVDYYRKEEYILRFKDRNGYYNVSKELYNETWLGRYFTTENNLLFFCIPDIDRCNSFIK